MRRAQAKEELGCEVYDDWRKMLDAGGFDMVVNSLPSPLHVDATIEAFKKGYHVLSEKPLAKKVPTPHTPLHPTLPFFFLALPAAREEPPSAPPALPPYLAATTSAPSSSLANLTLTITTCPPAHLYCRLPTSTASSPPSRNPARHSSPSSRIASSRFAPCEKRTKLNYRQTAVVGTFRFSS